MKKITAIILAAAIGLCFFAGCELTEDDQTIIRITDIPIAHVAKFAYVGIVKGSDIVGLSLPKKIPTSGTVDLRIIDEESNVVSIKGTYNVMLLICNSEDNVKDTAYEGTKLNKSIVKGPDITTISATDFNPSIN